MMTLASTVLVCIAGGTGRSVLEERFDEHCFSISSRELRSQVEVAPVFQNEIVLVPRHLSDQDAKAVASALHADITKIGAQWRFFRRDQSLQSLRRSDADWLKHQIDLVAKRIHGSVTQGDWPSVQAPFRAMTRARERFEAGLKNQVDRSGLIANELTPAGLLLVDLLEKLSPQQLAATRPGGMTIFSNHPVGLEKPLLESTSAVKAYEVRQENFTDWSRDAIAGGKIADALRWVFPSQPFRSGDRTLQLYVRREGTDPIFALSVFDASGRRESAVSLTAKGLTDEPQPAKVEGLPLGKVQLPISAIAALSLPKPGENGFQPESLDPIAVEPLEGYVREALLLWGKAKGAQRVVACVPDSLLEGVRRCVESTTLDLDELTLELQKANCETVSIGSALVIRPIQPLQEEATRIDRRPLSALYRVAASGNVGFRDLAVFHAAYGTNYEFSTFLPKMERPIMEAFSLYSVSGAGLPHALLAALGNLPGAGQRLFMSGGRISLDQPNLTDSLLSLARFANLSVSATTPHRDPGATEIVSSPATVVGSDLDRTGTRILSRPGGAWLEMVPGQTFTLVRRVSKKDNQFVDPNFVGQGMMTEGVLTEEAFRVLDQSYRFWWVKEKEIVLSVTLGDSAKVGPFTLRERGDRSRVAVSLSEVPGLEFTKPGPR